MTSPHATPLASRPALPPHVLVAEEDPHTLELLRAVFTAEHFRVSTASDGDEAIRRALSERPDLVVLEVRLPKRNGFEVCDYLRHDPDDPQVPIVFVAAAIDAEVRIEGLARGADDFLGKPFAPRELVARARRLLARASEARTHRRRVVTLEQELGHAQEETRRWLRELARERRLGDLAFGVGRDLAALLDAEEIGERTMALAMRQLACGAVALLTSEPAGHADAGVFAVRHFRGATAARFAGLTVPAGGELATLLAGLGRPVLAHELERLPCPQAERAACAGAGVALVAPMRGPRGLEGLLVADERLDGTPWSGDDREWLRALCALSATAHGNARRYRLAIEHSIDHLVTRAQARPRAAAAAAEAERLALAAAEELALPAHERAWLRRVVALGPWAWGEAGRETLRELCERDASRTVAALNDRIERAESLELDRLLSAEERHAALVAAVCVRYQVGRTSGRSVAESWLTASSWAGAAFDPDASRALAAAARETEGAGSEHCPV